MADLFEAFRNKYPHEEYSPSNRYAMEILKREDGFWLHLRVESGKSCAIHLASSSPLVRSVLEEIITLAAGAARFEEVAQATGSEGGGDTPSGATEHKSEAVPLSAKDAWVNFSGDRIVGPIHLDKESARKACDHDPEITTYLVKISVAVD